MKKLRLHEWTKDNYDRRVFWSRLAIGLLIEAAVLAVYIFAEGPWSKLHKALHFIGLAIVSVAVLRYIVGQVDYRRGIKKLSKGDITYEYLDLQEKNKRDVVLKEIPE